MQYCKLENIYNKNIIINTHRKTKENGLDAILPLEEYDKILIGFSGGKDSIAACLYLLELGVPKDKIILLHHLIDGNNNGNSILNMDWPCTHSYCEQFAKAMGISIKYSWKEDGFIGEILRLGASKPISFEELSKDLITTVETESYKKTKELLKEFEEAQRVNDNELAEKLALEIRKLGYRYKFPAKTANLTTRWCSAALKIEVCDRLLRYAEDTMSDCKILFVDGIRREESNSRSKYNEMEQHHCSALKQKNRLIHHWRAVIEWDESMVWNIIKKYKINPHPCYKLGWSRCSCACCIFSLPKHFRGIKEILPLQYQQLLTLEKDLGFTIDNKKSLDEYTKDSESCILNYDKKLIEYVQTGIIPDDYIIVDDWSMPVGAFHGAEGGPC